MIKKSTPPIRKRDSYPVAAMWFIAVAIASIVFVSCATPGKGRAGSPVSQPAAPSDEYKDRAAALVRGQASETPAQPAATQTPVAASPAGAGEAALVGQPAAEGKAYDAFMNNMSDYMSRLTYMVYYNEDSGLDPQIARQAVAQANRYIIERSKQDGTAISVIDFAQIEKNKQDQKAAYESAGGESVDLIQFLAEKFNANIYVEIDCSVQSDAKDGKYYASAQGSMKMFDVSSAALLGAVSFSSQPAFSPNSMTAAVSSAVMGSVWMSMPKMYDQSRALLQGALEHGVRYEVIVQNSSDARKMGDFEKSLGLRVRDVEEVSYSPNETRLYVYSFQKAASVRQALFDAAASAGMPDFNLLMARSNSYTFTTGL